MQTLRTSILAALLVGASTGPARADLLVVDAGGNGDYTEIQSAVSAASDGDTILVRGGQYTSFLVEDKDLRILPQDGAVVETGTIRVRNLGAGKAVIFTGLRSSGSVSSSAASGHAVLLVDNDGVVRFQDCELFGGRGSQASVDGWAAVRAESCMDVMLVGCRAHGGAGHDLQVLDPPPGAGGAGLEVSSSQVAVLHSEAFGGDGGWIVSGFWDVGAPGGAGADVQASYLFTSRSSFTGGIGGDCSGGFSGCGGDGGPGLVLDSSHFGVDLHATTLAGGAGGPSCDPGRCPGADGQALIDPGSSARFLTGPEHGLQASNYATADLGASIELTGTPGDQVFLFASDRAAFLPLPQWRGVLGLDRSGPFFMPLGIGLPPLEKRPTLLGVIPPSGLLELVLPVAALPAGEPVAEVFLQTVAVGFAGASLSEPRSVCVVSCDLPRLDCDQDGISDLCELAAGAPDINGNGIPDECDPSGRLYVRAGALPGGDGSSWSDAMEDLDDALDVARTSGGLVDEVWVAEGRYVPSPAGFELCTGLSLYGGFAGDELRLSQRDLAAHPTILSGDLAGDDLPGFLNRAENAETVLSAEWQHPDGIFDVRVDGFVISGGNGGSDGYSAAGYALSARDSIVANCTFTDNFTTSQGAGLTVGQRGVTVVNCRFEGNRAQAHWNARGGGMYLRAKDVGVVNCAFTGNRARLGGGLYLESNSSPGDQPVVVGCTFSMNVAGEGGGGIYSEWAHTLQPAFQLTNSILWGNRTSLGEPTREEEQLFQPSSSQLAVSYCCIEGLRSIPGPGNIGLDPSFVLPKGADGQAGTADDDLHLRSVSPCVDAGRNPALLPDHADLNLNGDLDEQTPLDIELLDRTVDDTDVPDTGSGQGALVDMGAHERQ